MKRANGCSSKREKKKTQNKNKQKTERASLAHLLYKILELGRLGEIREFAAVRRPEIRLVQFSGNSSAVNIAIGRFAFRIIREFCLFDEGADYVCACMRS
jgi:hypothetical protein